jgi:hypothetical protein
LRIPEAAPALIEQIVQNAKENQPHQLRELCGRCREAMISQEKGKPHAQNFVGSHFYG